MFNIGCRHCRMPMSWDEVHSLNELVELDDGAHDGSKILFCHKCNKLFLYYWVDIYEDKWQFWCAINKKKAKELTEYRKKMTIFKVLL